MTLTTLAEAQAANDLIHYLTTGHNHMGTPVTRSQAKHALSILAEGAYKKLGAGLDGTRTLDLLEQHWRPEPSAFSKILYVWVVTDSEGAVSVAYDPQVARRALISHLAEDAPGDYRWVNNADRDAEYLLYNDEPTGHELWMTRALRDHQEAEDVESESRISAALDAYEAAQPDDDEDQADADADPEPLVQEAPVEVAAAVPAGPTESRSLLLKTVHRRPPKFDQAEYALSMCSLARASLEAISELEVPLDPGAERLWESVVFLESAVRHMLGTPSSDEDQADAEAPATPFVQATPAEVAEAYASSAMPTTTVTANVDEDQADADDPAPTDGLIDQSDFAGYRNPPAYGALPAADPGAHRQVDEDDSTQADNEVFDPDVPKRLAALTGPELARRIWRPAALGGNFAATVAEAESVIDDVHQLVRRDAFARQENAQLAQACADYRGERNEARAMVRSLVDFMRLAGIQNSEIAALIPVSDELTPWLADLLRPADTDGRS